jgi:hypothetical protein
MLDVFPWLTLFWLAESDAELNTLKAMVENAITFFYLNDSSTTTRAPQMLYSLLTQSRDILVTNMKQSVSLTLKILKSIYPWADLDAAGEGFAATWSDDEDLKLVEDSAVMVEHIIAMLPVDMP